MQKSVNSEQVEEALMLAGLVTVLVILACVCVLAVAVTGHLVGSL